MLLSIFPGMSALISLYGLVADPAKLFLLAESAWWVFLHRFRWPVEFGVIKRR